MIHLSIRRAATTSPRTRHNGAIPAVPAESPQSPHAATVTADDAFTGQYRYDQATLTDLYAEGRGLLAEAEGNERRASELLADVDALLGLAARQRVRAADRFRLLKLAELDAVTPEGAAWPSPAPRLPQEPAPVVHFSDNVSFWPPCGAHSEATWQTVNPAEVTCEGCLASMAGARSRLIGEEPRADFGPPRMPVNGWGESPELPDTLTMPAVGAR